MNIDYQNIPNYVFLTKFGDKIAVLVRQSKKAKRVTIRINHERVELVIPDKNFKKAYDFLLTKESWVRKKLLAKTRNINNSTRTNSPGILPIFDKYYSLKHIDSLAPKVLINEEGIIYLHSKIDHKSIILKHFLTNSLMLKIKNITAELCAQENLYISQIKISDNKSNWGSCSSNSILSFNWRLVFVPLDTLYYVIVHELCHLKEMNHSKKFWGLVSILCPNYKDHKLWLKENSFRLHNYSLIF